MHLFPPYMWQFAVAWLWWGDGRFGSTLSSLGLLGHVYQLLVVEGSCLSVKITHVVAGWLVEWLMSDFLE